MGKCVDACPLKWATDCLQKSKLAFECSNCIRDKACQLQKMDEEAERTQQDTAPLTLDELRGMDGEPVWCDWVNQWSIVNIDSESRLEFTYCDGSQNTYGEIVSCGIDPMAYRSKPKEEV